jgi:hypothetical protein
MDDSDFLVTYGIVLILIVGGFIVVPILRGSREIITAWNAMLAGIIMFTGFGAIEVNISDNMGFPSLEWYTPTVKEMKWYMWTSTAAVAAILFFYYFARWPKRFGQRRLRKWPEMSAPLALFVVGVCFTFIVASLVTRKMTFFGPLTMNLALNGAPAGCVFAFMLWNRNRVNVHWLVLFGAVFIGSAMYAMIISGGRRPLVSMFLAPILCVYGMQARQWSRAKLFTVIGLSAVFIFSIGIVYSKFRWYNTENQEKRTAQGIVQQMHKVRESGNLFRAFSRNWVGYLGQGSALYAMLTERYIGQGALVPVPLNSLRVIASYPIPRKFWPNKPQAIGIKVVRETSRIPNTNWGLGFAGQGAYEGGVPALILYAYLLVVLIRVVDEPIKLQPDNPFLIYLYATTLPNFAGIARGDMGSFVLEILQALIFLLILSFACRVIFGSKQHVSQSQLAATQPINVGYRAVPRSFGH